jgi:hypothetical protein
MASLTVVYWRDIPAQGIVRQGRASAKRELSTRFIEAIDRAALRSGLAESDGYLAQWRRADPVPCGDDLEAEAERAVQEIEARYPAALLRELSDRGGLAAQT